MENMDLQKLLDQYKQIQTIYTQIGTTYLEQKLTPQDQEQTQQTIKKRSQLIEEADNLNQQIETTKNQICQKYKLPNPSVENFKKINYLLAKDIEKITTEIKTQLQKTIELDRQITSQMQKALDQNRQKRQDLKQGKKVYNAYNQNQAAAYFMDQKK